DRALAAIEPAIHQELQALTHDLSFGLEAHGRVGVFPVALDAQPAELRALYVDPLLGELAALAAELGDGHLVLVAARLAVALLDLPLDRQAVAVPAGDVVGIL